MSSTRKLRKNALCIAMGLCLASLATPVLAQNATGAVAGHAEAGTQISLTNTSSGATRTITAGSDGNYRFGQLAPGAYKLSAAGGAPVDLDVSVGGTTTVNLGSGGAVDLKSVQVRGTRIVNRVDVKSTEAATSLTREEIARLPVDQDLASVAQLAPGVVSSGATFGGLTFGGASVAENVVYINGLDVTDLYLRRGFSTIPFNFFEEVQVKTGGYSAEFGRSTGGVINAVTRSGGDEFHGGVQATIEPSAWASSKKDHFHHDGTLDARNRTSRDESDFYKANLWASGPIVHDHLYFFATYEQRWNHSQDLDTTEAYKTNNDNNFWGTKLDWRLNENHLVEFLAFSDKADAQTDVYHYDFDSDVYGAKKNESTDTSGGDNWSLTYTGHFTDNFVAKAMYGVNKREAALSSPWDPICSRVAVADGIDEPDGALGCHIDEPVVTRFDKRKAARLDFEWTLGNHLLRFGYEQEVMDSDSMQVNPGDGVRYEVQPQTPGAPLNDTVVPPGVFAIVDARRYITGSPIETDASAFYLEDRWDVTPNLLLNLGVRFDKFHNKLASGGTFAKADFSDMISPRLGFSWDVKGDGGTKLFGNAGRYYLPLTNKLADYFGGGTTDEHTYYAFNGWEVKTDPILGGDYFFPILGAQIGGVNTDGNAPAPDDIRTEVSKDLKMVYQDEYILGFQQAINQAWSWGVNATYRKVNRAVEDTRINHLPGCPDYSSFPIVNPGEKVTLWCEDTGQYVTFDSSEDGYKASGSGAIMGYKKPRRTYKAVEFQLDRAFDDHWDFNASYLWSKSEGNIEGPVNSDLGYADTNLVQFYDHPAVNERYGVLFNDHRHQFKFRGSYKFNAMWSVGGTFSAVSGGPITAFGTYWPNDDRKAGGAGEFSGGGSGWLCVANCDGNYSTRKFVLSPRGAFGRMPWVTDFGASVTWTYPSEDIDLSARLNVYNVFNHQTTINVHSRYERTPGEKMPYFGEGTVWQSPRYAQLVVTYNF
jgi:outer membrane receptor protein involved in Fe transport